MEVLHSGRLWPYTQTFDLTLKGAPIG